MPNLFPSKTEDERNGYERACADIINIVDDASDQISLDISSQIKKRIHGLIMKEKSK